VDSRLPIVPDVAARLSVERTTHVFGREVAPYAGVNFVGASRLSFDEGLDRRMGSYVLARLGATMVIGPFGIGLDVDNLFDARADTFAFGNPFSVRSERQYTPLRPRAVTLSVSRRF